MAQRFDPGEAKLEGEPFPLVENRDQSSTWGSFSVSETGVLVYARNDTASLVQRLVWYDREGRELGTLGEPAAYASPAISPDDKRVAFDSWHGNEYSDVWVWDVAENAPFPLTNDPRTDRFPVWSPDGKSVLFTTGGGGRDSLFRKVVGGESAPELLLSAETEGDPIPKFPTDWTADGRYVVYFEPKGDQTGDDDLWGLPLFGDRKPRPIVRTDAEDCCGKVSPDGQWLAFLSMQKDGFPRVYVQRFPDDTGPVRVSESSGVEPRWRGDGKELFYLTPDGVVMAVDVDTTGGSFRPGAPRRLFQTKADLSGYGSNFYDVTSDGERFLVVEPVDLAPSREIRVVLNWEALGRTLGRK